ncbi:MAG: hypothetical protein ACOYJE_09970 [Bacteroidaceae bacterium]|jgi:hypothetical protein
MEYLHYKVGGHRFTIAAPSREAAIVFLSPYESFEIRPADGEEPLFVLTLEPNPSFPLLPQYTEIEWDDGYCTVGRDAEDYLFSLHPHGDECTYTLYCSAHFRRCVMTFAPQHPNFTYALNSFLMLAYAFATAPARTLLLHASVVECGGKAYLFQGKSGTGKSTHSRLWLRVVKDAVLLNDDNPIVRIEDGQVFVYGSPWSGKTPCYRNRRVPAGAFVRLVQAPENHIRLCRPAEAFASLLPSCSAMKWDKPLYDAVCESVSEVVQSVPTYRLECLPDEAAARLCYQEITHDRSALFENRC